MKDLQQRKLTSTRGAISVMLTLSLWLIPTFQDLQVNGYTSDD
jgi:hypothetical protein